MKTAIVALMLVACSGETRSPSEQAGGASSGGDAGLAGESAGQAGDDADPDPVLGDAERARLAELSAEMLPAAVTDPTNAWADDPDAAALGQALFFDPRFSGALLDGDNDGSAAALGMKGDTGKVACAGCHLPEAGFSDSRTVRHQTSLGSGWGLRRAPSLLDVGQSRLLMWDGRRDSLFSQVFGPLESEVEMNSSRLYATQQILANYQASYEAIFGPLPPLDDADRFPQLSADGTGCGQLDPANKCVGVKHGSPGDGAEFDGLSAADQTAVTRVWVNVGKAIGAYERRLGCGSSSFDAWLRGDDSALGRAEQRGAALFVGKAHCSDCHSGPYLSDEKFHNVGLQPMIVATVFIDSNDPGASAGLPLAKADPLNVQGDFSDGDDGRLPAKVTADLLGAFRTPRLRCVAGRPSFMHTAQFGSLDEVVQFFDRGGDSFGFPGASELAPLHLSAREQADLVAFMKALSGPGPDADLLGPPPD
jgi:cytochrome c peroxidase